jgi:hypothetical protein
MRRRLLQRGPGWWGALHGGLLWWWPSAVVVGASAQVAWCGSWSLQAHVHRARFVHGFSCCIPSYWCNACQLFILITSIASLNHLMQSPHSNHLTWRPPDDVDSSVLVLVTATSGSESSTAHRPSLSLMDRSQSVTPTL